MNFNTCSRGQSTCSLTKAVILICISVSLSFTHVSAPKESNLLKANKDNGHRLPKPGTNRSSQMWNLKSFRMPWTARAGASRREFEQLSSDFSGTTGRKRKQSFHAAVWLFTYSISYLVAVQLFSR